MSSGGRTPRRVARLLVLTASNRLIHGADGPDGWRNTGHGGTGFGGDEFATPIEDVARNLDEMGGDMPERVARWLELQRSSNSSLPIIWTGERYDNTKRRGYAGPDEGKATVSSEALARRLDDIGAQHMTQSRTRYDLLVELCAGTAALSWASAGLKFPVSRMGSKSGYAHAILSSVGLREGDPLPRYLWNEPDPELARTLALLASPGGAQAVAAVIRSWIPCPNGHEADGGSWCLECATWTNGEPTEDVEHVERKRDGTIRRWASGPSTGKQDARRLWERLRKERPEASPARECALLYMQSRNTGKKPTFVRGGEWRSMTGDGERGPTFTPEYQPPNAAGQFGGEFNSRRMVAGTLDSLAPLPATVVCGRAEDVSPPPDCSRVLVYIDPPYLNTTGYAHKFDRAAVVAVARRWAEAGAHVVISEAEPIPELVADGWTFSDIADARIGQRRTFSRQQREVLTSNRPLVPRHAWPSRGSDPRQGGLFAQG